MSREDLEAALAAQFDAEHLSVYGDYLEGLGDPRGELIALDLAEELTDELVARREAVVAAWLGADIAALLETSTIELGFVMDLRLDGEDPRCVQKLDAILASPAAASIRGATIHGTQVWIASVVGRLAERLPIGLPWLTRLAIQVSDTAATTAVDDRCAARLITATPRLEELEVCGTHVFGELPHPAVRSLRVTGTAALGSLRGPGPAMPMVAVVDLAFARSHVAPSTTLALLLPERLPSLRWLDLSRNEPTHGEPDSQTGDAFHFLSTLEIRAQLRNVRVPSVRDQRQADALAAAITGMPYLRELSVARAYERFLYVRLPAIVVEPPIRPWPPTNHLWATITFGIHPTSGDDLDVPMPLPEIMESLEDHFDELSPRVLRWWRDVFAHGGALRFIEMKPCRTAIDLIDATVPGLGPIANLRDRLDVLPPSCGLSIRLE